MIKPGITQEEAKQNIEDLRNTLRSVYDHRYGREELTAILGPAFEKLRQLEAYIDATKQSEQAG